MFVSTSFGNESAVLLHLLGRHVPVVHIVELDSDSEWQRQILEAIRIPDITYLTGDKKLALYRWAEDHGMKTWYSGIRSCHTPTRANLSVVQSGQLIKVNPLFHWSDLDMKTYAAHYGLPFKLRDPNRKECGLHV